jgi:hypothetical protein
MASLNWQKAIVDKSNLWFNAIEMERQGRYLEAANLYLRDSRVSLKSGSLVRSALDCSSAASCVRKTGNFVDAQKLYVEAGSLYEENANAMMDQSVRESLWSLRLSYRCFLLANEGKKVSAISSRIHLLVERVDPFIDGGDFEERKKQVDSATIQPKLASSDSKTMRHPEVSGRGIEPEITLKQEVSMEVQNFLSFSRSKAQGRTNGKSQNLSVGEDLDRDFSDHDSFERKSFVNQLG